jgi:pantoate--beta-alanine ligase
MQIVETVAAVRELRAPGKTLGLVPTMGALHEGHLSLVRAARESCDIVAVSIFVNPTQFGPKEDFATYPRTFAQDCEMLDAVGADVVFAPSVEEMYPSGATTIVEVEGLSDRLDGASRPGHFRGVATVVSKLFHIFEPDRAFFGQKDAAQVAVLRKMVRDLCFRVELVACPIVREPDGLAMSSRNRNLSPTERVKARVLSRTLHHISELITRGETESGKLIEAALQVFATEPDVVVDYCRIVDPNTLEDVPIVHPGTLVAVAAKVGTTRLIDNFVYVAARP